MKLKLLLKHLKDDRPFEPITAFVSVTEFQKRVSRARACNNLS